VTLLLVKYTMCSTGCDGKRDATNLHNFPIKNY
jgi:hypothetical protein